MNKVKGSGGFIVFFAVAFLIMTAAAIAHEGGNEEDELVEGKELFESGISCNELSNEQLEVVGEYLMEQMHPGEAHDLMHSMMGIEEGTSYHDRFHLNLAQAMYCDAAAGGTDAVTGDSGMMGTGGMMPMMRMMPMMSAMAGQGMMGSWGYGSGYGSLVSILYVLLLLGLIALVYFWTVKLWRSGRKKR